MGLHSSGWCLPPPCAGAHRFLTSSPGKPHSCDPSSSMGNQDPYICIGASGVCRLHRDQSMVLTFTLSILGCSALLLAAVSGQQVRQRRCPVPHIENGRRAPSHYIFRPGDRVRFTCNTGYTLQGSPTSVCQSDFSWSPPLPACKKEVMCLQPPNIANGLHSGQSMDKFPPGAIVSYSCKDGFELVGNVSINCSAVGRWSRPLPRCKAIGCQSPTVRNGKVQAPKDTYEAGEMLWFNCNPGYAAEGSRWAQCKPGGSWDPPVLSCERIQPCPMPPKISNGDHNGHGKAEFTMGMYVMYTCNLGYYLAGDVDRVFCKASGKWSQPSPRCEEVTCPQPPNIANGLHSGRSSARFPHGTTVSYSCKDGFELVGNVSINCSAVGRWSRPLPRCQAIGCQRPTVHNGKVQAPKDTYEAGETLWFDCNPGYAAEGSHRAQCHPGGSWDPPVLSCEQVRPCPMPPKISNGDHNRHGEAFFTTGMSVTYTCDPTFYLVGNAHVVCRASGTWSQPSPRCEATICLKPDIQDGWIVNDHGLIYAPGQMVTFQCKEGYSLHGSAQSLCQKDGRWDPPVPLCDLLHGPMLPSRAEHSGGCGVPTRLNFAELNEEHRNEIDFSVGKTVGYTCRPGFVKHPGMSPTITCLQSGVWSEALEFCKRRQCNHPGEPENGRITVLADLFFGSTVVYSCEEGHRLIGQPSRRCEISGNRVAWTGDIPTCQRIPCEPPPSIPHGKHTGRLLDEFHYGISVTYSCEPGYPLHGDASIFCTTQDGKNGVWSGPPPVCGEAGCSAPQIQNGRIVSAPRSTYAHNDTVTFQCEPGYIIHGPRVVQCQQNNTWQPPVPICEQAGCRTPPRLEFAELKEPYRNQSAFLVGATVEYRCQPGYAWHVGMSPTITCLGNQSWSVALEFCKRMQCVNPEDPQNGRAIVLADLLLGSKVNYTCNEGYKLIGHLQRTCEVSGAHVAWSGDAPTCHRIVCDPPPDIPHGTHSGRLMDTFPYATPVTYTCEPGRVLTGTASIFCTTEDGESGAWSGPPPSCGEVQCPPPPSIANGKHNSQPSDTFLPGAAVQYTCKDGYLLTGNASITCTAAGTWSRPRPRCEAIGCKRPDIENGRVTGPESIYMPEDIAVFECDFGYALRGSQKSQCQFEGTWDPPVPTCEKMLRCPSPPNITHGQYSREDVKVFVPGTSVRYSCDPGYVLTGKTTVTCLTSGVWSIPYPRCEVVTCMSPSIKHGEVAKEQQQAVYHPGTIITIQCHPGYVLRGRQGYKCHSDGRWVPSVPSCEPALPCPPPPTIAHGIHDAELGANFTSGMSVNYSCQTGFSLIGDPSVQCMEGNWSLPYPHCAVGCGTPTRLQFADLNKEYKNWTEFPVGTTVRYTCLPGYARHSQIPPTIKCLENQTWSEAKRFCRRRRCDHPREPENGRVIVTTDLFFGSTVNYTCDEGYRIVGASQRHCVTSGSGTRVTWSGDIPICQSIVCDPPPDIPNATHSGHLMDAFPYAAVVTYTCEPGHVLAGTASIFCTTEDGEHGAWSGPPPHCGGQLCPSPPEIDHGQHDGKDVEFIPGMSVNYSCDPGYSLTGKAALYCTDNGSWSSPQPRCEVLQCPTPPNIDGGNHNSQDVEVFLPGMVVNYSCDPGYSLLGEASIYCTESGKWSLPIPQCEGSCGAPPRLSYAELVKEHQNVTAFPIGSTVRYSCRPGFMRHPTVLPALTCLKNHTWSDVRAFCKRQECNYPEAPQNGRVVVLTDLLFRSIVNYTCEEGYRLVGQPLRRCELSGADIAWSGEPPTCQMVKCRPPPSITNGEHGNFSDTFGVGAIVHYRCKPGFILIGNESIQCTMHGVWSHPLPQCEAGCVSPGIGHGKAIGRESLYMPGDIITIECNTDNSSKVLHKSQCRSEGMWFPPLPACDGVLHCSKPPDILHGSHSGLGKAVFTPGTSINYSCETGFSLIGMISIYCTESGTWSHPPPVCKVVKCLHPPAVTNGKLQGNTSDTYFYGASLSYSCDSGYSLIGDAFITCTASGTWSHPPPQCKEISCIFPEVQGVKKSTPGKTYRFGTNITLECDDGYTLEGLNQIQCQEDFSWDPPVPACKLTSPRSGSVGLGIAAAVVLLLLGVTIGWKIISKQKEGYYRTYENYNYKSSLD